VSVRDFKVLIGVNVSQRHQYIKMGEVELCKSRNSNVAGFGEVKKLSLCFRF
jgi:hypothetical protein